MLRKLAALPLLAFVTLSMPLQALAQTQTQAPTIPAPSDGYYWRGPMHMWADGYGAYGWHPWGMFPMLLLIVIVAAALFFIMRHSNGPSYAQGPHHWNDPSRSALQILNERFARGEIQKQEFEEKKAAILSGYRS